MNFISAEELLNELEDDLHKYYVNGLESSFLLPKIERQLLEIGVNFLPKKSVTIEIKNNVGKLPSDFHYLILAVSCTSYKVTVPDTQRGILTYEQRVCDLPVCKTECDYWHDENGRVAIYQRFFGDSFVHRDVSMLTVKETISDECCNPINQNKYDIEIKNGLIYTNKELCDGTIYMEYRGSLDNKGDLLIPDFPEIKDWLMEFCRRETFKRVFYNEDTATPSTVNKLQYSDKELHIARENAKAFWKRNSKHEFDRLKQELINKFNKMTRL